MSNPTYISPLAGLNKRILPSHTRLRYMGINLAPGTSNVKYSASSFDSEGCKSSNFKYTSFFLDIRILQCLWFTISTTNQYVPRYSHTLVRVGRNPMLQPRGKNNTRTSFRWHLIHVAVIHILICPPGN